MTTRFNEALEKAVRITEAHLPAIAEDVVLIRDLMGRIRVLLKKRRQKKSPKFPAVQALAADLAAELGAYAYPAEDVVFYREELGTVTLPDQKTSTRVAEKDGHLVLLHDRLLVGAQWNAPPVSRTTGPKRFTLFSMKGGVGRSTTAVALAWHLARQSKNVLVVDLDLESPGVGSTLLPQEKLPDYGLVDWFVEDALGQAASVEDSLVVTSPLAHDLLGKITVAPSFGKLTGDYLPKLGRSYLEQGPGGPEPWTERLQRLVRKLEQRSDPPPDVVLLDSRTGLHDTSAALVLAMGAVTLLFAVDSRQTWTAYDFLFKHWQDHPSIDEFRRKLWMVTSMIPESDQKAYLRSFRDRSWILFLKIYDDTEDDAFYFNLEDERAPHAPHLIRWHPGLQTFDPTSAFNRPAVELAYEAFLKWFDDTLLTEGDVP
jgi:MinD-like ATPase involved in chromosome partitioning or flagellar assembly